MIGGLLFLSAAAAQGALAIKQYLRDPIGLYDEKGAFVRKVGKNELPPTPFATSPGATPDRLRITIKGQNYFVRSSDVMTVNRVDKCVAVANTGRASGTHLGVSKVGIKSSVDENAVNCRLK